MTLWSRSDYQFEKEEDFLKVCYGFARKVHSTRLREEQRHLVNELYPEMEATIQPVKGLLGTEVSVFLREVTHRANIDLHAEEIALLNAAVNRDVKDRPPEAKARIRLHRARRKLAELTGWSGLKRSRVIVSNQVETSRTGTPMCAPRTDFAKISITE